MLNRIRTEPALISGLAIVLVNAAVAFGLTLTDEQTFAINAVVAAVLALVTRARVIPVYNGPAPVDQAALDADEPGDYRG